MSTPTYPRHPTWTQSFTDRANLPDTPHLTAYLFRLMVAKRSNLCLSADVETTSELLRLAEECGDAICVLKTHADIVCDFSDRTISGLAEIAARKKFLIFEDRKLGDIGNTVQMQYAAGPHRIASWAHIVNAHIFPGPAIITALHESANSAVAANNSTIRTEISGGDGNGFFAPSYTMGGDDDDSDDDPDDDDFAQDHSSNRLALPSRSRNDHHHHHASDRRKGSVVSISTTISTSTEYITPPTAHAHASTTSASSTTDPSRSSPPPPPDFDFASTNPPLARGLLLLAQMSSADNLFTAAYTQRCLELARADPSFVLGFIAQEALNTEPGDNFVVMTPGVNMPPAPATEAGAGAGAGGRRPAVGLARPGQRRGVVGRSGGVGETVAGAKGDALGQQYNTPRKVILDNGVDVVIVGRGLYKADDPGFEAERYRKEAWGAYTERVGGRR